MSSNLKSHSLSLSLPAGCLCDLLRILEHAGNPPCMNRQMDEWVEIRPEKLSTIMNADRRVLGDYDLFNQGSSPLP